MTDWQDFRKEKRALESLGRKGAPIKRAWLSSVYRSLTGKEKECVDSLKKELMSWPDVGEVSALELIFTLAVLLDSELSSNKCSTLDDFFFVFRR